mgnify:CR=1 FL=1
MIQIPVFVVTPLPPPGIPIWHTHTHTHTMFRSTLLQPSLTRALASRSLLRPALSATPAGTLGLRALSFKSLRLIPQPPGGIVGSVNDPVAVPLPDASHGSYHWSFERLIVLGIVPLTVLPLAGLGPASGLFTPVLDATLGSLVLLHSHLGFESCIIDYIPKRVYGVWHKIAIYGLWTGTATALFGIYKMETEDIGLASAISAIWSA